MIEVCHISHVRKAVIIILDDDLRKLPREPCEPWNTPKPTVSGMLLLSDYLVRCTRIPMYHVR